MALNKIVESNVATIAFVYKLVGILEGLNLQLFNRIEQNRTSQSNKLELFAHGRERQGNYS